MNSDEFRIFVEEAREYCRQKIEETKSKFGVGNYERYDVDLEKATLRFSDAQGNECVTAAIQAAGSWSSASNTWLWSWENESIPQISRDRMLAIRSFGNSERLPMLAGGFENCREVEAWAMAAVAGQMLSCEGFYRVPNPSNHLFLLLFSIQKAATTNS
ncbi:MAG: DUF6882 domain-containing protein [Terracidiphilus sp.]|jgi:hypothetical protein